MKKKEIRVAVADFSYKMNFFIKALKQRYEVVECWPSDSPDILFYSCFGLEHLRVKHCTKIFISQENVVPDFNECDYAISCVPLEFGNRNLFLPPCYATYLYRDNEAVTNPDYLHRKFCSFLYSQDTLGKGSELRKTFCQMLAQYRHVDCPGKILHNIDVPELSARGSADWNESKIRYLSQYKFNIAFENSYSEGYVTEKLMDCFYANTIPIYWGGCTSRLPFSKEAMICVNDFGTFDEAIQYIKEVDQNDELYLSKLAANPLRQGFNLEDINNELQNWLEEIVEQGCHIFDKDGLSFSDAARLGQLSSKWCMLPAFWLYGIRHAYKRYLKPKVHQKGSTVDRVERRFLSEMLHYLRNR